MLFTGPAEQIVKTFKEALGHKALSLTQALIVIQRFVNSMSTVSVFHSKGVYGENHGVVTAGIDEESMFVLPVQSE